MSGFLTHLWRKERRQSTGLHLRIAPRFESFEPASPEPTKVWRDHGSDPPPEPWHDETEVMKSRDRFATPRRERPPDGYRVRENHPPEPGAPRPVSSPLPTTPLPDSGASHSRHSATRQPVETDPIPTDESASPTRLRRQAARPTPSTAGPQEPPPAHRQGFRPPTAARQDPSARLPDPVVETEPVDAPPEGQEHRQFAPSRPLRTTDRLQPVPVKTMPSRRNRPADNPPQPSFRIAIGRIEVRARLPKQPTMATSPRTPYRPPMTLEDYLNKNGDGS